MAATVVGPFGAGLEFETLPNHTSVRTAKAILAGETYPVIPAVRDVAVVLDAIEFLVEQQDLDRTAGSDS